MSILIVLLATTIGLATARHHDPELKMSTKEVIEHWGYPAEEHWVTTPDGYILLLHRIPRGAKSEATPRRVVFLQHGLIDSSATWVLNKPDQSLGFMMADAGYDVWMGNARGNIYTTNHTTLSPKQAKFWEFSFDEMAEHDLPTMVNFVLQHTGAHNLSYVGHSQGTEMGWIGLSQNYQDISSKINMFMALAPVARISHVEGFFKYLNHFKPTLEFLIKLFGLHDFAPSNWIMHMLAALVCPIDKALVCRDVIFLIAGHDLSNMNKTRVPVYVAHCPAGTSSRNVIHWAQMINAKKMQKYDFETPALNMKHYNSTKPPQYNITSINVPVAIVAGGNDYLGDPRDVAWLEGQLNPNIIVKNIFYDDYNHLDFVWGLDANRRVYDELIGLVDNVWN